MNCDKCEKLRKQLEAAKKELYDARICGETEAAYVDELYEKHKKLQAELKEVIQLVTSCYEFDPSKKPIARINDNAVKLAKSLFNLKNKVNEISKNYGFKWEGFNE